MAKWLTAAGLENHEEDRNLSNQRQWGNIGANESREDEVRNYITVGWGVFWRLSDIARKLVYEMTETNVSESNKKAISPLTRGLRSVQLLNVSKSNKFISPLTRGLGLRSVQMLETTIQQQQLEYITSFPGPGHCELTSYYFMHLTISSAFADRVFDNPRGKASKWRTGNEYMARNSWLNWLVLREGPDFFARAWGSKEGNEECLRHIRTEWSKRSNEQLLIEHAAAKEVEDSLVHSYVALFHHNRQYWELIGWAKPEREIERVFSDVHSI